MSADALEQALFVYGSLQRGQANHGELGRAVFLGVAQTQPVFALRIIDGYPALVPGQCAVSGELYRIASGDLVRLDQFEGAGYYRQVIELEAGSPALAYVAIAPGAGVSYPAAQWPAP
ncbi:MAG: gamma-glutamylcyclotransferase family protein [Polyangiaceae bacterium]